MMKEKVGFTTTIPVEILLAADKVPVDLNNLFINHPRPHKLIEKAENAGFPANLCGWIKGIYGAAHEYGIRKIIAVTQGDCSNTHALMEILENERFEIMPFAYPYDRDYQLLKLQIEQLMERFGVNPDEAEAVRTSLLPLRGKLKTLDELTYKGGQISGFENHYYLVSASDFFGDVAKFTVEVDRFLAKMRNSKPDCLEPLRVGYLGVPPIMSDFYSFLESLGVEVVYNELARQFAMLTDHGDLVRQYQNYTYPYKIFHRLRDINEAVEKRKLRGLIHYTQSFCFRQLEDIIIRQQVKVPILTIEGNTPDPLDGRTRLRLESFAEMLRTSSCFGSLRPGR